MSRIDTSAIVLETDVLFDPNSWELPDGAADKIKELVADVPDGAAVEITGHTDSQLTVDGLGDSEPAETEDPEEPGTLAANRRVEIYYDD